MRQLPVRRDGTGYAFVLRNGLSPVIGRPPVIWRDRSVRRLARRVPAEPAAGAEAADAGGGALPRAGDRDAVEGGWRPGGVAALDSPDPDDGGGDRAEGRARRAWDEFDPWA